MTLTDRSRRDWPRARPDPRQDPGRKPAGSRDC